MLVVADSINTVYCYPSMIDIFDNINASTIENIQYFALLPKHHNRVPYIRSTIMIVVDDKEVVVSDDQRLIGKITFDH